MEKRTENRKIGWIGASAFVVANMVGTGIFTSLGFQLETLDSPVSILILWVFGGVIALCGALTYSELGSVLPRSGGEYNYLSVIYGPGLGFVSGWVSMIVGFAAPAAVSSMAFGRYVCAIFPGISPLPLSISVLALLTLLNTISTSFGSRMHNALTVVKVLIMLTFIVAGLTADGCGLDAAAAESWSPGDIVSPGFAVALVWVYYSFSGWNTSAYISEDVENPGKNVPRSLLAGTLIVTLLYMLMNYVFIRTTPASEMKGVVEVGLISANRIFGPSAGKFMGLLIAGMLLSSISSLVFVGPRMLCVMGSDHRIFGFLSRKSSRGCPVVAEWVQFVISLCLILTDSFSFVVEYTSILLSFFAMLTVLGVFVHRRRFPSVERPYLLPGYPVTPLVFILLIVWSVSYLVYQDVVGTFVTHTRDFMWMTTVSVATVTAGYLLYLAEKKFVHQ